ncbi:MAG TPA: homoserine kinase [Ktedonobacterales bacterium]
MPHHHRAVMRFVARGATVTAPATCANLGPGFDCIALALDLRNTFTVSVQPRERDATGAGACRVELTRDAAGQQALASIETGADNLFCRAFALACERVGVAPPDLTLRIDPRIPPSRGLGSSATAVVGGLLAANTLLGEPLDAGDLLALAIRCEPGGHADNVAAALHGGLVVTGADERGAGVIALPLPIPQALRAVVFIPDMPMSTVAGRALLPESYPRGDVAFNLSRVALLLGALQTARFEALGAAMDDRIHQPYRAGVFPALPALLAAARGAGAHGACLSGGGSSVLALVSAEAEQIAAALADAAAGAGVAGRTLIADISRRGTVVSLDTEPRSEERSVTR